MNDQSSLFLGDNPFDIARRWLSEAQEVEVNDPDAASLATVDQEGLPNVRVVLMREIENDGFVFYTNYNSVKGQEIAASGMAAFVFHWKTLHRQIRVRGLISKVSGKHSDEYYQARPVQSRIGAWASEQSEPLADRETLIEEVERLTEQLGDTPSRPAHWGGYRIIPLEVEFWADGAYRLHDRFRWTRETPQHDWQKKRLYP